MHNKLAQIWELFLDTFFPRRCVECKAEGRWLCSLCVEKLVKKFWFEPVERDIFGLFSLEEKTVRELVHYLKYNGIFEVAEIMKQLTAAACSPSQLYTSLQLTGEMILVPVPISTTRLKKRGYNQAELFARTLASWLEVPIQTDVLVRASAKSLVGENKAYRSRKIFETFLVQPEKVDPLVTYIVVDDVVTTGSTLKTCRFRLVEAGAKRVIGLAFGYKALTPHNKREKAF